MGTDDALFKTLFFQGEPESGMWPPDGQLTNQAFTLKFQFLSVRFTSEAFT